MRTLEELTPDQRAEAVAHFEDELYRLIEEGALRFNDEANGDDLQRRIDSCFERAEELQTPWFVREMFYEDSVIQSVIESMAYAEAEDARYTTGDEPRVILLSQSGNASARLLFAGILALAVGSIFVPAVHVFYGLKGVMGA